MKHTREETAMILIALGYEVDKNFKFKLRADEKTPSASINPRTGKIKDFGSGWDGSAIDLMVDLHGYTKSQAFNFAQDILGRDDLRLNLSTSNYQNNRETKNKNGFITQSIIDKFIRERKENFDRYWELLSQAIPTATNEQKKQIAQKYDIGYSKKSDRLIMPIKDEFGNCMTLWKYNKFPKPFLDSEGNSVLLPKVIFSKDRKRCPFNLQDLQEYRQKLNEPIFVLEGEKDCLNALAAGLRGITLGSASSKIDEKYINLFKDTNITICYDHDEAGKSGSNVIYEQLKGVCKKIEIIDWERMAKQLDFNKYLGKGFDFTDYLVAINSKDKSINKCKEQIVKEI